ncbi:hypothetical protein [Vibrio jasicida]|uniref:hypothetical protein n=1 Tax=Vibrio jasicida TaxID=766224 RepID=UPI0005ED97C3|nr:hypothetical protein [Vibrio jasicida]
MFIRNTFDTSNLTPPRNCRSWLHYWEKRSGMMATHCSATNCHDPVEKGAHVRKENELEHWHPMYIVPLCLQCYSLDDTVSIPTERRLMVIAPCE